MRQLSWMLVFGIVVTTIGGAFSLIDVFPVAAPASLHPVAIIA
jgi:hypothetical protein